jgi:type IV pilus assembly protein PilV
MMQAPPPEGLPPERQQRFRAARPTGRGMRGVSLIEALVAILIFAFGVLGMVGLQASMTRAQTSSKFRADAATLASEVIGLMWIDRGQLANYATDSCSDHGPCLDWKNKVTKLLPGSAVAVTADGSTGAVDITLTWTVPGEGTHTYATSTSVILD